MKSCSKGFLSPFRRSFLVLVAASFTCPFFAQTIDDLRNSAIEEVYNKQYAKAEALFTQILELDPEDEITYLDRGLVRESLHNIYGAMDDFTRQIAIDSSAPDGWFLRGILLQKTGDTLRAMDDFKRVIELDHYNSDAHLFLGQGFEFLHNDYSADTCYYNALSVNPENQTVFEYWIPLALQNADLRKFDSLTSLQFSLFPTQLTANYWSIIRNNLLKNVPLSDLRESILEVGREISYEELLVREFTATKISAPWVDAILGKKMQKNIDRSQIPFVVRSGLAFRCDRSVEKGLKKMKKNDTQQPEYHRLSAIYFSQQGKWKLVIRHIEALLSEHAVLPDDYLLLAYAKLKSDKKSEACKNYASYLSLTELPVLYPLYKMCQH